MRVLHTGDWHIGQTLKSFGREHEHREVLDEIVATVAVRGIDALIVAGDVFDSPNPSGTAQKLFYDTMVRLHRARPAMTIVVIAGNHDAAGRLEAPRALLDGMNIRVVGNVLRPGGVLGASRHLIDLKTPRGDVAAQVLAVSYPTATCLPVTPRGGNAAAGSEAALRSLYSDILTAAHARRVAGVPLIVTGHLHVAGGLASEGSERRILVGGDHAVSPDVFPAEAAYVALGHLHKAQSVGRETLRYCGSILPLSATEQSYAHGTTLVTLDGSGVTIEPIRLKRPVPFLRLPSSGDLRLDALGDHLRALELDPKLPLDYRPFAQVRLARDGLSAGFRAEAERIADLFPIRLVDLKVAGATHTSIEDAAAGFVRLAERAPEDLFRAAFERHHGTAPEVRHVDAFRRIAAGL
jgi:exonuclease SbcD